MTSPMQWIARHDRNFVALRRAGRGAIVTPALFALAYYVIGSPVVSTYAAYGAFALLLLVDFSGPMRQRLESQLSLVGMGAVLICLGTLVSGNPWLAATAMTIVAFIILFSGVISSELARATTSLLLAFILAVSSPAPLSEIPARLEGWALAGIVSLAAISLLWPAPQLDPLRSAAATACRATASALRSEVAILLDPDDPELVIDCDRERSHATAAVGALYALYLAFPYRPTALGTSARAVLRLVDELNWSSSLISASSESVRVRTADAATSGVKVAAASVLERGAELLDQMGADATDLRAAVAELRESLTRLQQSATSDIGAKLHPSPSTSDAGDPMVDLFISSLEPLFRAQELGFSVSLIARNIELASAAERRGWLERMLGMQPTGLSSSLAAAQARTASHAERHSVWLHNSVRGAVGLGLAVLVAHFTGVERSFWVIFAALSVLRSSALHTGQNVARALAGTVLGFVACAVLLAVIGTSPTVLWILLPLSVFLAGVAPAAISFTAGQAAFTLTVVILYNIVQPAGWRAGLIRVEDIALGCAVSLVVGALFWPRGAGVALRKALAEAYTDGAAYLVTAVEFGTGTCDLGRSLPVSPRSAADRAGAAATRLDDTFRNYLAERGAKPLPLADLTPLVTGVSAMRLAADAIVDLWGENEGSVSSETAAACRELLHSAQSIRKWFDVLSMRVEDRGELPEPQSRDDADEERLVDALRRDLHGDDTRAIATAVCMLWTADHLDSVRRLQTVIVQRVRAATERKTTVAALVSR